MSNFRFELKHLPYKSRSLSRWCLDFPCDEDKVSLVELTQEGIWFQGWVLAVQDERVRPYVKQADHYHFFDVCIDRDDVVQAVVKEASHRHLKRCCGFRERLTLRTDQLHFGVEVDGMCIDLIAITVVGMLEVVHGAQGWLFLDNDTNRSVEQYTGKLRLDTPTRNNWKAFFDQSAALASSDSRFTLLIAPAKESVYSDKYPYPKPDKNIMDELLALLPSGYPLLYPVEPLKRAALPSFRVTDTHWTPYGASLAAKMVASQLGLDTSAVSQLFANDTYRLRSIVGDLGVRLFPNRAADEALLTNFSYRKWVVYDNGLANFGRVLVLDHSQALQNATCLVFGSSSAYSMLDYLCRIFSVVVVIHSAGNIDQSIIRLVEPEYIVCQTNARFVIRAPVVDYSLYADIQDKLGKLTADQRQLTIHNALYLSQQSALSCVKALHQYLQPDQPID